MPMRLELLPAAAAAAAATTRGPPRQGPTSYVAAKITGEENLPETNGLS